MVTSYVATVMVGVLSAMLLGQDANGDQRIAHAIAAWLLVHPEQDPGFSPGSWIPGMWNLPWLFLALHAPAWLTVSYLGALHASAFWLVGAIAWTLLDGATLRWRWALSVLAVAFCFVGAATRTELATTFGDLPTSIPLLAAVLIYTRSPPGHRPGRLRWCGVLLGLALGLKLTNLVYVLGFLAAVLATRHERRLRSCLQIARWTAVGSVLVAGYVWLQFWVRFQNPIFPFFNGIWQSPYYPNENIIDGRFLADSTLDMLTLPWRMAALGSYPSERLGRDLRWPILATLVVVCLVTSVARRFRERPAAGSHPRTLFLYMFMGTSWLIWLVQFGIARYLITVELLSGLAIILLLRQLLARPAAVAATASVFLVAVAAWLVVPSFDRQPISPDTWFSFSSPDITEMKDTLAVFVRTSDLNYTALALPGDATTVEVPKVSPALDKEITLAIRGHQGPMISIGLPGESRRNAALLARYGVQRSGPCSELTSSYGTAVVCPIVRSSVPGPAR